MARPALEKTLVSLLGDPAVNICIDGPSGTGKTSLARTTLDGENRSYMSVEVTSTMDWLELCKAVIHPDQNLQTTTKSSLSAEVKNFLPGGGATREESRQSRPSDEAEYVSKLADNWSERDVVNSLQKRGMVLVLDNLEQASSSLVSRLSDLAKLMVDKGPHPKAKLICVGTNDIYDRLLTANGSLSRRLKEVSVGAFRHQGEAWRFIKEGFDALDLLYPGNSRLDEQNQKQDKCVELVYRAAGGLPKGLNELGKSIALRARPSRKSMFVSASDVQDCASEHFREAYAECKRGFPSIMNCLTKKPLARQVFMYLFKSGICSIHNTAELLGSVCAENSLSDEQVDAGIQDLVEIGFLTRSGSGRQVLFTKVPEVAHILGVVLSNPAEFSQEEFVRRLDWQLELPGW